MKKIILLITFSLSLNTSNYAQIENEDLILLATAYHKYHSTYKANRKILKEISKIESEELKEEKDFFSEIIKPKNKIYNIKFVSKPDSSTLKTIFIIRALNHNLFSDNPKPHETVIDEIKSQKIEYLEFLAAYYDLIFGGLINKHDDLDLSETNYEIDKLGFESKEEKAVFFLVTMERMGSNIWGYMNIPVPTDYENALEEISRYPKFNGEVYYKYSNYTFKDFKLTIDIRRPKESFKDYYLDKYFGVLKYHLMCLDYKKDKDEK